MNTYEWVISKLEVVPQVGSIENYVTRCHWKYIATDGTITKETFGLQGFETNENPENYVAFDDLTKEIVEGWLEVSMDMEAIKAELDSKIADEITPPIVSMPIPW